MAVGPIQLIVIGFRDFEPTGKILAALEAAVLSGAIRVVDLQFVRKTQDGAVEALELTGLSADERVEFGAVIGGLLGAGIGGVEGALEGAIAGALAAADETYGLTPEDVQDIAEGLAPGEAAGMLMIEHTWAIGFRNAVRDAGGEMLAQGFLTPKTLLMIGAELEAQERAMAAVTVAAAVEQAAAERAVAALTSAALIEEAARDHAAAVVLAALSAGDRPDQA